MEKVDDVEFTAKFGEESHIDTLHLFSMRFLSVLFIHIELKFEMSAGFMKMEENRRNRPKKTFRGKREPPTDSTQVWDSSLDRGRKVSSRGARFPVCQYQGNPAEAVNSGL